MSAEAWPKTLCLVCGELLDHHRMCRCTREGYRTPNHVEVVPAHQPSAISERLEDIAQSIEETHHGYGSIPGRLADAAFLRDLAAGGEG